LPIGNAKKYYSVVQPGKRLTHRSGDDFGEMEVEDSRKGQTFGGVEMTSLVLHGSVHYEDPTGAYHTDGFCMRGNKDGESFHLEGGRTYNYRETKYPDQGKDSA
jgi:hypothetical protein